MADKSHALELTLSVSSNVKDPAIKWTDNPVVLDVTSHADGVNWPARKKIEHFRLLIISQRFNDYAL
jgi:hypothetical protein